MVMVMTRPASRPRPYRKLGERIAQLRDSQMSQRELARRVGFSEGYTPQIERGESCPSPQVLRRIAETLGGDYNELAALAAALEPAKHAIAIHVPLDEAADVRWFASLPKEMKSLIRRVGKALGETSITGQIADARGKYQSDDEQTPHAARPPAEHE